MSLVATLMQPLRKQYRDRGLDKLEQRRSMYGAWNYYQQQASGAQSLIDPDLRATIKKSFGNTIQVPVFNTEDVVITNVRACTVPDLQNTTALVTLTFVTYAFGFTMIPSEYFNNDIKYERDFNRKLEKFIQKLAATLETASANNLSTNKNTYWPAKISAYYPVVGNALQITQAQKNDAYNQFNAIMKEMDFASNVDVITTLSGAPMVNRLNNQGAGNAVNESFQFNGYEWFYSNGITNGAGVQSTGYLVQPGTVAVENRNDPDTIMNSRIGDIAVWDEIDMPLVNLRMGSYYYANCADVSAYHSGMTGLTRVKKEGFEFSTDVCFVNSYNSDPTTRFNPIVKFEISAS
jgi:hypothetical protein